MIKYERIKNVKDTSSKKVRLNFIFGILAQAITLAIGIVIPRLFIVSYGSEVNGYINSVNQIFVYVALLEAGVGTASLQAMYSPMGRGNTGKLNGILSATNKFYTRTAIAYTIIIACLSFVYPLVISSDIPYHIMVGIFLINGFGGAIGYFTYAKYKLLLSVDGRGYVTSIVTSVSQVLLSVGKIVLLLLGCNVLLIQSIYLLLNIIQAIIFKLYVNKHYSWLDLRSQPDVDAISKKNSALIHQISGLIFNNTDVLLLTFFCNLKVVSVYALYKTLISLVGTLITHFINSFSFKMGQTFDDRERFLKLHDTFETFHIALTFALCTVAYICFLPFLRLYTNGMDANYLLTYMPLLVVVAEILSYVRLPAQNVITFAGHFKETQWRSVIESAINLSVSLVLVYLFESLWGLGIYGVLMGTVVALMYRTNDILIYANKKILGRNPVLVYKTCIICIITSGLTVLGFNLISPNLDSYISVIIAAAILAILTVSVNIVLCFILDRKLKAYLPEFVKGLFNRRR